jgi:hypothetical protein
MVVSSLFVTITMTFTMPISMSAAVSSRMIIGVFPSLFVVMVPDGHLLIIFAFPSAISFPVDLAMAVWLGLIHHDFISPVNIIIPVPHRQGYREGPAAAVKIDILLPGHGIIHIDIRHIIVIHMIIAHRPPAGLRADVDIYTHLHLPTGRDGANNTRSRKEK